MKNINTLVQDIYSLVQSDGGWFDEKEAGDNPGLFGRELSERLATRLGDHFKGRTDAAYQGPDKVSSPPGLRLSKMGTRCPCALWHEVHCPHLAEPLPPWAKVKYAFGHILEALLITLAKASGHEVTGEQDALELDGVPGHRDCVIDGAVVDIKSAASRSYLKFKTGSIAMEDSFGYLFQLSGYVVASRKDPLVRIKDRGYLFAIDKQLGHMCLYEHQVGVFDEDKLRRRIDEYKEICERDTPPPCECKTIETGNSGNIILDFKAAYSPYKYCCFPNLRTFLYAEGPKYFTHVAKLPKRSDGSLITEVDKFGNIVYNG